jgi:hypothetical protein
LPFLGKGDEVALAPVRLGIALGALPLVVALAVTDVVDRKRAAAAWQLA